MSDNPIITGIFILLLIFTAFYIINKINGLSDDPSIKQRIENANEIVITFTDVMLITFGLGVPIFLTGFLIVGFVD
ncbi:hypothetical protein HYW21_08275 [Candidatus Woesearchaeota archaeon]|nr:hypothetical protein [Candidatus Woesearchaeota archaeon]